MYTAGDPAILVTMEKRNTRVVKAAIAFNLMIVCALLLLPMEAGEVYIQNYVVDVCCLLVVSVLYVRYSFVHGFNVFDPILFITLIYSFLYFVAPIYDILIEKYTWFGYRLFQYGVKSSVVALGGYIAFYLLYVGAIRVKSPIQQKNKLTETKIETDEKSAKLIVMIILFLYAASFAANVFYLLHSGYKNILYILTMGILGKGSESVEELSSIRFVAMFSYCLPTLTLLYWEYGRNKWVTLVLFIPMLMMQITRGFRFIIIQIAVSFVAYYFISRKKKPKLRHLLAILIILMVPVLLMTLFRNDVRSGVGISLGVLPSATLLDALDDAIWDNFRIYNNYYGIVHSIPSRFPYVYLRQILIGTLVMAIPHAVWPGKIATGAGEDLSVIIGSRLAGTGQAYPGLGEFYYAFGIFGVLFFMALYGIWMRHVKVRFFSNPSSRTDTIVFAVLLGANLQILIRGYTPSNFWYVVFSLIPIYIVKSVEATLIRRKLRNGENS